MYKIYTEILCVPKGHAPKLLLKLITVYHRMNVAERRKWIMRLNLTLILLLGSLLHVSAVTFAQTVTYNKKGATLEEIFNQISLQTGYEVLYSPDLIDPGKKVDVNFRNTDLKAVLNQVVDGKTLKYKIEDKNILISRIRAANPTVAAIESKETPAEVPFKNIDVRGTIMNKAGVKLAGATVAIMGTAKTIIAREDGTFYIPNVDEGSILEISYVGYLTKKIKAKADLGDVILELVESKLDEVQIIAYGSEQKRFSIGAVATVSAAAIARQPVTNPLLALQGQVPGLAVTATNGVPGSTALLQVRGQNTLGTTLQVKPYDQPLFIIDGVPFAPQNVNINQLNNLATAQSFSGGVSQATGLSPFNSINPNDIESITILKDASATSIYGSQGANGVVLITTKRGKSGKTTFDLNLNSQLNYVARPVKLLNTQQYLQLRKEAFAADGLAPSDDPYDIAYAPDLTIFDQNKYTDWEKIIAGKTTNNTDLHATISGGGASSTFLVATGYTRSNYNYPGSFSDQRFTLHSALHNATTNKRFTLDLVTDFGYDQNKSASYGGTRGVVLAPNLPDLADASGNLIWNYKGYPLDVENFYSSLKQPAYLQSFNFNGSLNLSYIILPGLTVSTNIGYNRISTVERSENPASSQNPSYAEASAAFGNTAAQTINVEPQINYRRSIGKGVLTALLGGTYKKVTSDAYQVEAYGYSNDNLLGTVIGATTTYPFETINLVKYSAAFARLKYVYDEKYIIEISGRRDGSSNFGPGRQFGNFASAGAGWIFSEEQAFKEALPFFTYGKLSGSYGTTGGDASKAYSYQALYQNLSSVPAFQNIRQTYAYNLYNPDFSWATKKSLNLAVDLGFFNNRLFLNATYYRNRESNQLVDNPLPIQSGFTSVFGNLNAVVQNQGWEFTATSTNIKSRSFSWTTNFNLTLNRNKLVDFPGLVSSSYADKYIIGQPVSIIIGYKYKGVNPGTGLYEFYDKNGNATYNPKFGTAATGGDQVPIGNMDIKYMGGLGNNFTYKNFNLYVFCQFSSSNAPNFLSALYSTDFPGALTNQPAAILGQYWKKPGDQATIQRLGSSYTSGSLSTLPAFGQSDGVYSNDTYLRVKTVSLSYTLPDAFLQKVHVKGGSIYVNAQNLFTITNYKVGDPEQPGTFTAFPLQRIVAFGLTFKF